MLQVEQFIKKLEKQTGLDTLSLSQRAGFETNMAGKIKLGYVTNPSILTLYLLAVNNKMKLRIDIEPEPSSPSSYSSPEEGLDPAHYQIDVGEDHSPS